MEKRTQGERYSTPFFCAPNWDAVIQVCPPPPPGYATIVNVPHKCRSRNRRPFETDTKGVAHIKAL